MINKNLIYKDGGSFPVFATKEFLSHKSNDYGWFVDKEFCLPYYVEKKLFFKYITFPHEIISLVESSESENKIKFLNSVMNTIKTELKYIDFIIQSPSNVLFGEYPDNAVYCEFGSYKIDLSLAEEELFSNLHSKHRNVVRKAIKENVTIKRGTEYKNEALFLVQETMKRQNMAFVSDASFYSEFNEISDNIECYVAVKDGVNQGSAIIYWSKDRAYYIHGGSIEKPYGGSINLMHWEIIKDMKSKGVKNYDFVGARIEPTAGSKLEGIQRFKSRFGAVMDRGYLWKYQ